MRVFAEDPFWPSGARRYVAIAAHETLFWSERISCNRHKDVFSWLNLLKNDPTCLKVLAPNEVVAPISQNFNQQQVNPECSVSIRASTRQLCAVIRKRSTRIWVIRSIGKWQFHRMKTKSQFVTDQGQSVSRHAHRNICFYAFTEDSSLCQCGQIITFGSLLQLSVARYHINDAIKLIASANLSLCCEEEVSEKSESTCSMRYKYKQNKLEINGFCVGRYGGTGYRRIMQIIVSFEH